MNSITKRIIELSKVDLQTAIAIQQRLEQSGLDFSECTKRELDRAIQKATDDYFAPRGQPTGIKRIS